MNDRAAPRVSLERLSVAWADRILPAHPRSFLLVVAGISVACWLAGLLLAEDRGRLLASREWQVQPLFLAVHLVVVRLFVTAYAGGYLAGCRALDMPPAEAKRRSRTVLGPRGFVAALVLAAPLAVLDVLYVEGVRFESETSGHAGAAAADWLLASMWSVEWVANAYVWVVIAGFLFASMRALAQHDFRDPVAKVLAERQYRPFLLMSAQGASIVLAFGVACGLYVLYAHGETSDYIGLWVTAGLLLAGFVPPWLRLRGRLSELVQAETDRILAPVEGALAQSDPSVPRPRTLAELGERVEVIYALLRAEHLERLHRDVGRMEAQAVVVRLLAPIATVVWRFARG